MNLKLISYLKNLIHIKDDPEHHPEESTYHHVIQSFRIARKESDDRELWVAALFHDIGKLIESHGHENHSVDILIAFGYKNEKVLWLIRNHMKIRWFLTGKLARRGKVRDLLDNQWISELIHLRRCDGLARKVGTTPKIDEQEILQLLEETNDPNIDKI